MVLNDIINSRKSKINGKRVQIANTDFVSPSEQHVPDIKLSPVIKNENTHQRLSTLVEETKKTKEISLPQTNSFMIPEFLNKNPDTTNHCPKCVRRFKELSNDFIKMAKTNLVSELPFSSDIQNVALKCTKCNSEHNLILTSKKIVSDLRKMCKEEEPKFLKCPDCKMTFTATEKILEAFHAASIKYNHPDIDLTRIGKKRFLYNGIDTQRYASLLENFAKNDDYKHYEITANKYNLEVANAMANINIHHWAHFESCFKYSKSKVKKDRKCR